MKQRSLGSCIDNLSALGFGCMRFPEKEGRIDREESSRMLDLAYERGVNYLDTAWPYHDGESEEFLGEYLESRGIRNSIYLASKMPCWMVKERKDFDYYLNAQLKRLKTDRIDFYLLHALDGKRWRQMLELDVLGWLEEKRDEGKIRFLGFSFHDEYPAFETILADYQWDFCQIQYNYMNTAYQAGRAGMLAAAERGIGVIVMEPLLGGRLVEPPAAVQAVWDSADRKRSPADWALQWLWDQPEVGVVLSGMSSLVQVEENIESASRSGSDSLTAAEKKLYDRVEEIYGGLTQIPCTDCKYCLPCPEGVNIPRNFSVVNSGFVYDNTAWPLREYGFFRSEERASACVQCGICVEKCPQGIPISAIMPEVDEVLSGNRPFGDFVYPAT